MERKIHVKGELPLFPWSGPIVVDTVRKRPSLIYNPEEYVCVLGWHSHVLQPSSSETSRFSLVLAQADTCWWHPQFDQSILKINAIHLCLTANAVVQLVFAKRQLEHTRLFSFEPQGLNVKHHCFIATRSLLTPAHYAQTNLAIKTG